MNYKFNPKSLYNIQLKHTLTEQKGGFWGTNGEMKFQFDDKTKKKETLNKKHKFYKNFMIMNIFLK